MQSGYLFACRQKCDPIAKELPIRRYLRGITMRLLTEYELDLVAGGGAGSSDEGEVVISHPPYDPWDDNPGNGPSNDDNPDGDPPSGGGGGGDAGDVASSFLDTLRWVIDHFINAQEKAEAREKSIADKFDPRDIRNSGFSEKGQHWTMKNGDYFIDTNQNGIPDTIMRYGPDGRVYADKGYGFQDTGRVWASVPGR